MPHPYTATVGGLSQTIVQLRSAFPSEVTSDTLKKWSIAPNNESYIINVLRFLGLIDDEGKKQTVPAKLFNEHDDDAFAAGFAALVKTAYKELFEAFGDKAWDQPNDKLIGFFRNADGTSSLVGTRQAQTFRALGLAAGHPGPDEAPKQLVPRRQSGAARSVRKATKRSMPTATSERVPAQAQEAASFVEPTVVRPALTVRIEINLPVTDDQTIYDKIFRSLRTNLINESVDETD